MPFAALSSPCEGVSQVTVRGTLKSKRKFNEFCKELGERYASRQYKQWIYDVSGLKVFSSLPYYLLKFMTQVLVPHKKDMAEGVSAAAIIVGSPEVKSIVEKLIHQFSSGAPRRIFTAEEAKAPGLVLQWLQAQSPKK